MRRLLSTGVTIAGLLTMSPAHGVDLPARARIKAPVATVYDRTGFYIGGSVGWADKPWELANGGPILGYTADGGIYRRSDRLRPADWRMRSILHDRIGVEFFGFEAGRSVVAVCWPK